MKIDNQLTAYILTSPSINGERSRWLLRYFGIKYQFNQLTLEPLALIPALKYASKATGSKYVYIVNKKSGLVFRDPHKLLEYLNPMFNEEIRLGEDNSEIFKEVIALSDKYVRIWSYATFGPLWSVFLRILTHHVSRLNQTIFYVIYPLIALLLRVVLSQEAA